MKRVVIRRGRVSDSDQFIGLVMSLAKFEKLEPPSPAGKRRLLDDIFRKKRVNLFVASQGGRLIGYALYFYSYSSFLAKPTLYLEDLFVSKEVRGRGTGMALLKRCVKEAIAKECGRMEWSVLTWNSKAIEFYEALGARRMSDWHVYRLDSERLKRVNRAA